MISALAKQLKDAGFPQKGGGHHEIHFMPMAVGEPYLSEPREERLYFPTLSELILWCGDGFFAISHWYDGWQSEGGPVLESEDRVFTAQIQCKFCQSPEEAVAKLLLILKKK